MVGWSEPGWLPVARRSDYGQFSVTFSRHGSVSYFRYLSVVNVFVRPHRPVNAIRLSSNHPPGALRLFVCAHPIFAKNSMSLRPAGRRLADWLGAGRGNTVTTLSFSLYYIYLACYRGSGNTL